MAFAGAIGCNLGSVVAYELESRRRASDTFPTYVSFNLETNQVGALSTGFLPPRFSVFDLNAQQALSGMSLDQKAVELIEERWRVLQCLRESRGSMSGFGRDAGGSGPIRLGGSWELPGTAGDDPAAARLEP